MLSGYIRMFNATSGGIVDRRTTYEFTIHLKPSQEYAQVILFDGLTRRTKFIP